MHINIISDPVCPWCFVGKKKFDKALEIFRAQHPGEVQHLLRAYPAEAMSHYPVSTHVNNPRNEDPLCIEPLIS